MSVEKKVNPPNQKKKLVDFHITEDSINNAGMPVDYSFKKFTEIKPIGTEFASRARTGKVTLGNRKKFLSRSLWLNHNAIRSTQHMDIIVESVFEYPERLGFLDLSHNQIKELDESIFKFKNIKVFYLHDNKILEMEQIFKMRQLKYLQHLTLFANPFYDNRRLGNIRTVIKYLLPQIKKLDYNKLAGIETESPVSANVLRFLEEKEGRVPCYIPTKVHASGARRSGGRRKREQQGVSDSEVECVCCPAEGSH